MGLTGLPPRQAPAFSLVNGADGGPVSLSSLRGHVVVLTFANAGCNDICPVLADELTKAGSQLGKTPVPVTFVTVNTDPLDLSVAGTDPVFQKTALPSLAGWQFLTGTIAQLDPVWKAYGVSIVVDHSTGAVTHNDVLFFIRPDGTLAWSATPFADESATGVYSLPASQITRFATGIATYADELART
jgi:protein SCO1/2